MLKNKFIKFFVYIFILLIVALIMVVFCSILSLVAPSVFYFQDKASFKSNIILKYELKKIEIKIHYSKKLLKKFSDDNLSDEDRLQIVEDFLYKELGADDVAEDSRGEYVNAKHLVVLEKIMGRKFYSTYDAAHGSKNPENPNIVAGQLLESGYQKTKAMIFAQFLAETYIKDILDEFSLKKSFFYSFKDSLIVENKIGKISDKLEQELKENPQKAKQRIFYVAAWLKGFVYDKSPEYYSPYNPNCFYTKLIENDRELKWKVDSLGKIPYDLELMDESKQGDEAVRIYKGVQLLDFHARRGDDVVYGDILDDRFIGGSGNDILDGGDGDDEIDGVQGRDIIWGGNGNDIIRGGEGNDIIIAGDGDDLIYPDNNDSDLQSFEKGNDIINAEKGNDKIYSYLGNDSYIYKFGDGHDVIIDENGRDIIIFYEGISVEDLLFERVGNDLKIVNIKNRDDSITIKDWYKVSEDNNRLNKIEYFKFLDNAKTYKAEELFNEDNL